jgi:hypothetical protein
VFYLRDEVAGPAQQRPGHLASALPAPVLPEESDPDRPHSLHGHLPASGDCLQLFPFRSSPQGDLYNDSHDRPSDAHHRGGNPFLVGVERADDAGI